MSSNTRKIGAAFGLASIAAFSVALPASAAVTASEWGVFGASTNGYDAAVTFTNPDFPGAEIMVSSEMTYDWLTPDGEGEGFTAADPLGLLIGANLTSTDYNFLKVQTAADNTQATVTDITFDSAVPAGQLVLAISDIDSDRAEITMRDANDNDVAVADIIGTATTLGFNWDDITNTTDVPTVETGSNAVTVQMWDAPDGTDGSTGWVRPSVAITEITITTWTTDGNSSGQRFWLGQVIETEDTSDNSLPNTGIDDSIYLVAVAGGAMLVVGGLVGLRRRQA